MTVYIEQLLLDEAWRRTRRRRRFLGSLAVLLAAGAIIVAGTGQGGDAASSSSTAAHRDSAVPATVSNVQYRQRFGSQCSTPSRSFRDRFLAAGVRTDRGAAHTVMTWMAAGAGITALTIRRPDGSGRTGLWSTNRLGRVVPLNAAAASWTGGPVVRLRWLHPKDLFYAVACAEQAPPNS